MINLYGSYLVVDIVIYWTCLFAKFESPKKIREYDYHNYSMEVNLHLIIKAIRFPSFGTCVRGKDHKYNIVGTSNK